MDGHQVAAHYIRGEERHREVLQNAKGEDKAVLQQSALNEAGQPPIIHEPLHAVVQQSEETSGAGKYSSGGGLIVTVSSVWR